MQDSRAQIQLDGEVDEYGMAGIKGEISLFDPAAYTDIAMIFRNLEMNNMTPYSGKFVGRRIDSGKLSLFLEYRIEDSELQGDNQIVLDNMKLGERVESKRAIDLPLNLAVAVLEDENGIIDLGMPVSGDLSDPKFSYGHLVWKAFVNMIKKIATSPFRALGAMLGEDTQGLDVIAFEKGAWEVPPPEKEKLHRLAQALEKRPNLKVVVQGRYSREADGFELKSLGVRRLLAARLGIELDPAEDPGPPDYGNAVVQAVLESIYVEHFGVDGLEALKNSLVESIPDEGEAKNAMSPPEGNEAEDPGFVSKALYEALVEEEPLEESALISLADTRAQAIIFNLVRAGKLPPQRVSTKASEALELGEPVAAKLELEAL